MCSLSAPTATHPTNRKYSAESKQPQMDFVKCDEQELPRKQKKKTKPNPPSCRRRIRKQTKRKKTIAKLNGGDDDEEKRIYISCICSRTHSHRYTPKANTSHEEDDIGYVCETHDNDDGSFIYIYI